jgi:hypothetical protein
MVGPPRLLRSAFPAAASATGDIPMTNVDLRAAADTKLGELSLLQRQLLEAAHAWARGAALGPEVAEARHAALRICHERCAALVPVYRELAEPLGAMGPVPLEVVVDNLMFSGLFKSYPPEALASGDFGAMTEWLQRVSTGVPAFELDGASSIGAWRARLREHGVFLSFSSGTSGRLSFVPRDLPTFRALLGNGASYADPDFPLQGFDCLVLGPRGEGVGLLDAGNGLARAAARSHFLFDRTLRADDLRSPMSWADPDVVAAAEADAIAFARSSTSEGRPLLVFGAPFQVQRLCRRIASREGRLAAPEGSLLVTGGGWKAFSGERIARGQLTALVAETLGIPARRCIDSYSTAEINASLVTCREGRYHVPPLLEAVILDEALRGVLEAPGEGLLGFLDPFATSYPGFVVTGDRATLAFGVCGCGRSGAFIDGEIERAPGAEIRGCGGLLGSILA